MLRSLDIFLTIIHLLLIGFNLTGWIWVRTRKWHLACVILTAASWMILGIWYGLGYCPITAWQWDVKEQLGERNLPPSFITYFAEKILQQNLDDNMIDIITTVVFAVVGVLSVYVNFFKGHLRRHSR